MTAPLLDPGVAIIWRDYACLLIINAEEGNTDKSPWLPNLQMSCQRLHPFIPSILRTGWITEACGHICLLRKDRNNWLNQIKSCVEPTVRQSSSQTPAACWSAQRASSLQKNLTSAQITLESVRLMQLFLYICSFALTLSLHNVNPKYLNQLESLSGPSEDRVCPRDHMPTAAP